MALTTAAPAVFPAPPQSRGEALESLKSADAAKRAEAIVWLANLGGMGDAPLLEARLRDESEFVRGFAEQGLWLLWSRSGDLISTMTLSSTTMSSRYRPMGTPSYLMMTSISRPTRCPRAVSSNSSAEA